MDMSIRFPGLKLVLDYVPKSFEIFGFEITIYGVLIAVGMLLGIFFVVLEARRNHEDPDGYLDLTIITLIAGVIGARLLYAAFSWSLYKNDPGQILNVRSGGMLFYGGLLGGVLSGAVYCRLRKKPFWKMADLACMGILIGQIIGKWGSFFNRESFGEYADNIFSMQIPLTVVRAGEVTTAMRENLQTADGLSWIIAQPLFLYESLWCLLVFLMLMMHLRKRVFQGEIFLRYLAGYGLGRAVIQWFRTDKVYFPGTEIDVSLVISGVLFVLCTVIVTVKLVMARKRARVRKRRIEKDYQAEKEAAEMQAAAIVELAEATRKKGLAEAEAQRALNDAINVLSDEQTSLKFKLALLQALPAVIEKSVEPMKAIDGIKIIQVDGLNRGGATGDANTGNVGGGNLAEQALSAALSYRTQAPLIDSLLNEIGVSGGSLAALTSSLSSTTPVEEKAE